SPTGLRCGLSSAPPAARSSGESSCSPTRLDRAGGSDPARGGTALRLPGARAAREPEPDDLVPRTWRSDERPFALAAIDDLPTVIPLQEPEMRRRSPRPTMRTLFDGDRTTTRRAKLCQHRQSSSHNALRAIAHATALNEDVRRRPTLPRGPPRSTIGAEGLNFRVRNGTGCFPFA